MAIIEQNSGFDDGGKYAIRSEIVEAVRCYNEVVEVERQNVSDHTVFKFSSKNMATKFYNRIVAAMREDK